MNHHRPRSGLREQPGTHPTDSPTTIPSVNQPGILDAESKDRHQQAPIKGQLPAVFDNAELLLTDILRIEELPETLEERRRLRALLSARLLEDFQYRISLFPVSRQEALLRNEREYLNMWDSYVLEAAQQYGARIFLAEPVIERLWAWANGGKNGFYQLKRLFNEVMESSKIRLRQHKGTITDRHREAKKFFVPELKDLQERLRTEWPESADEVRKFCAMQIDICPPPFPYLRKNKTAFLRFLSDDIAMALLGDPERSKNRLTPTQFFVNWVAWSENRSSQSTRIDLLNK